MEDSGDLPKKDLSFLTKPKKQFPKINLTAIRSHPTRIDLDRESGNIRESFGNREERLGTRLVDMNQDGEVYAQPDKRVAIGTSALSGCSALVVLSENPSNSDERAAVMAHYDPMAIQSDIHTQMLPGRFAQLREKGWRNRAFIISPGQGDAQSPTGYSPSPTSQ